MDLIFNEDCNHWLTSYKKESDVKAFIDQFANSGVKKLFVNFNAQRCFFDSKVLEHIWDNVEEKEIDLSNQYNKFDDYALLAKKINSNGEIYDKWFELCREKGISPWASIRVNDGHTLDEGIFPKFQSMFWIDHPELRRVKNKPVSVFDQCFDFSHEIIRKTMLDYIEEVANKFDVDGIEIDWMRFGFHFKPGYEDEGREILNDFMRKSRNILDKAEKKWGHKIAMAARVPVKMENAYNLGYDAVKWARENLIDILTVSPFWFTVDNDVPIELWKQLLYGTNTKLAVGIEYLLSSYSGAERYYNGFETICGSIWSMLDRGADYLYVFNYMNLNSDHFTWFVDNPKEFNDFLNTISDKNILQKTNKRFVSTYCDTWAPGQPVGIIRPTDLCDGLLTQTRIHIGEVLDKEDVNAYIVIGLEKNDGKEFEDVRINGFKCEKCDYIIKKEPIPKGKLISYKIQPNNLHACYNLIETYGGQGKLIWMEIDIIKK